MIPVASTELAPDALVERLASVAGMGRGRRRLVLLLPQLGDFDSLEYAQALVAALPQLESAGIVVLAIGIGQSAGADRFCEFTGFPRELLQVDADPQLHRALGLYEGLQQLGGPWPNLLLMCAGIGSPGTLAEVLRGYTGDRTAPSESPMTRPSRPAPYRRSKVHSLQGLAGPDSSAPSNWPRFACAT